MGTRHSIYMSVRADSLCCKSMRCLKGQTMLLNISRFTVLDISLVYCLTLESFFFFCCFLCKILKRLIPIVHTVTWTHYGASAWTTRYILSTGIFLALLRPSTLALHRICPDTIRDRVHNYAIQSPFSYLSVKFQLTELQRFIL